MVHCVVRGVRVLLGVLQDEKTKLGVLHGEKTILGVVQGVLRCYDHEERGLGRNKSSGSEYHICQYRHIGIAL